MDISFLLEVVGAVAFGISGAFVAVQKKLDYFGVCVLAGITAVGGGMLRDVILGITPPVMFKDPIFALAALMAAFIVIVYSRFMQNKIYMRYFQAMAEINVIFDAVGLSIFCIVGTKIATDTHPGNMFLAVFVGVLTGIGGGMMRDVLVSRTPLVLKREIYAMAAIVGCTLYYILAIYIPKDFAMYVSVLCIFLIRLIAVKNDMHLPSARPIK